MKEKYETPEIAFVSFELSQNIAAGCTSIQNAADTSCPITVAGWGGLTVYTDACDAQADPTSGKICYDVPTDFNGVHSS